MKVFLSINEGLRSDLSVTLMEGPLKGRCHPPVHQGALLPEAGQTGVTVGPWSRAEAAPRWSLQLIISCGGVGQVLQANAVFPEHTPEALIFERRASAGAVEPPSIALVYRAPV